MIEETGLKLSLRFGRHVIFFFYWPHNKLWLFFGLLLCKSGPVVSGNSTFGGKRMVMLSLRESKCVLKWS